MAGKSHVYELFQPEIILVDEAAKVREPDVWNVLARYNPDAYILVWDQNQLLPTVLSAKRSDKDYTKNKFAPQLQKSFFTRVIENGLPYLMFEEQHRMHPDISALISEVFYDSRLIDATIVIDPGLKRSNTSVTIHDFNVSQFGIAPVNCFIDLSKRDAKVDAAMNHSKFNLVHIAYVLKLVQQLVTATIPPSSIIILVPYEAQGARYREAMNKAHAAFPKTGFPDVRIRNIDAFQGGEADVVIADLVVSDSLGFMSEGNRLNVCLSRAKCGLYVIGNMAGMKKAVDRNRRFSHGCLARLMSFYRLAKTVYTFTEEFKLGF